MAVVVDRGKGLELDERAAKTLVVGGLEELAFEAGGADFEGVLGAGDEVFDVEDGAEVGGEAGAVFVGDAGEELGGNAFGRMGVFGGSASAAAASASLARPSASFSTKTRRARCLAPPVNSRSTRSRPCEAATRSAVARIVSICRAIVRVVRRESELGWQLGRRLNFRANKKWAFAHSSLPPTCRCAHGYLQVPKQAAPCGRTNSSALKSIGDSGGEIKWGRLKEPQGLKPHSGCRLRHDAAPLPVCGTLERPRGFAEARRVARGFC